jgi:hypothetical protein
MVQKMYTCIGVAEVTSFWTQHFGAGEGMDEVDPDPKKKQ